MILRDSSSNGSFTNFPDRKPRLHLRPGTDLGIPALHVRIVVERKTLRLVGHGPGEQAMSAIQPPAGVYSPVLASCRPTRRKGASPRRCSARSHKESSPPRRARNGRPGRASAQAPPSATSPIGSLCTGRADPRPELAGLLRQIHQDRPGLEHRQRAAAIGRRRHRRSRESGCWARSSEIQGELLAGPDVDGFHAIGKPDFFQHDRHLLAVRRRRVMRSITSFPLGLP